MHKTACVDRSAKSKLKVAIIVFFAWPPQLVDCLMTSITSTTQRPSWSNRPAITWDEELKPKESCYWNDKWLNLLQDGEREGCKISYKTLISAASFIAADLQTELKKRAKDATKDGKNEEMVSIPIVVAIPEGPLLPLAVLVVHALNNPTAFDNDDSNAQFCFSVLVPLEPSEPRKRNIHILKDISPDIILTASGKDMDTVREMINSISIEGAAPTLIDLPEMIYNVVRKIKSRRTLVNQLDGMLDEFNEQHLHALVFTYAKLISANEEPGNYKQMLTKVVDEAQRMSQESPRISHIVYTSGTTGMPKGCISSISSLECYLKNKNQVYDVSQDSRILLASALSFDPCLSDCLATFEARATLAITPRSTLLSALPSVLQKLSVTHVLCTPTLWSLMGSCQPQDFPSIRAVVLGGEPIPRQLQQIWARKSVEEQSLSACRLYATYGVTEACVYQTCGELLLPEQGSGQHVGQPFQGLGVRICREDVQDSLVDVEAGTTGEIILYGSQLDDISGYLKRPEINNKFVLDVSNCGKKAQHYRTGDRGVLNKNGLQMLGRIIGEEGMVKVNGVRVELGEIENALIDEVNEDDDPSNEVIINCMTKAVKISSDRTEIRAYCILSDSARKEVGLASLNSESGILVNGGPLLTLLRARCMEKVKAACIPKIFVLIPRLPLSPTGKRDRDGLPDLDDCIHLADQNSTPLKEFGVAGAKVAEIMIECLNLQPSQEVMLTTNVTFAMLGGDSLAATRVTRALYAYHNQVQNNRFLGGQFGKITGPFDVVNLLRSKNLGSYVQMLDEQNLSTPNHMQYNEAKTLRPENGVEGDQSIITTGEDDNGKGALYDALLQAATLGQTSIAFGLLDAGADPNAGSHSGRLGKVSHRLKQQALFRSSPLHLACLHGEPRLVKKLLANQSKFNSPDASGLFPLHLASSGVDRESSNSEDDFNRLLCVQYLLEAGAPMTMRDSNKQSVLHCAARAGHCQLLEYVMKTWKSENGDQIHPQHFFNWNDRWMRSAVHWAVLNGQLGAVEVLLKNGCNPNPPGPKNNNRSSAPVETPLDICQRLYGVKEGRGAEIKRLLSKK